MRSAVIVEAVRLASGKGKPGGALSRVHPVELLSATLTGLMARAGIDYAAVDDVIGGCVHQAGEQALNITRQAVLAAGFPEHVPATTVDRQCGSSQQAAHFAAQGILAGAYDVAVACGVDSMSRVPMGSTTLGRDPYGPGVAQRYPEGLINQGVAADVIASRWNLGRDDLDEYAATSHRRAAHALDAGLFNAEILPLDVADDEGRLRTHHIDETVRPSTTAAGLASLRSAFRTEEMADRFPQAQWRVTAGNSSPLTDGASAVLIMSEDAARRLNVTPRARFVDFAVVGDDPLAMLTAPIPATRKVLQRSGLTLDDIAAYEVNEAFASVPLAWAAELHADPARLNPLGGAIALGHALGSSGTRLLTTLVHHLEATRGRYGLQTMCEAGGMANATVIERLG